MLLIKLILSMSEKTLTFYFTKFQTKMLLPWQVVLLSVNPPVSCKTLTTSVGYMKGFRHICRPVASGRQDSSTGPSRLLTEIARSYIISTQERRNNHFVKI